MEQNSKQRLGTKQNKTKQDLDNKIDGLGRKYKTKLMELGTNQNKIARTWIWNKTKQLEQN